MSILEDGVRFLMDPILLMTLSFYRLSLDQCLPNFYSVVNSVIRLNNLYGLGHNHHDINFKYSICSGLKTSYYLKIHDPMVRLILCLFDSNRNSMRAFVKVTGNWHASELTCPMSHRQIGRYFYFPSTHSVGLRASSVKLRKRQPWISWLQCLTLRAGHFLLGGFWWRSSSSARSPS